MRLIGFGPPMNKIEITGTILGFKRRYSFAGDAYEQEIIISCRTKDIPFDFEQSLRLSEKWKKLHLKKEDRVQFSARLKVECHPVNINTGEIDEFDEQLGQTEVRDIYSVLYVSRIIKLDDGNKF